jgi:hypothetical protein
VKTLDISACTLVSYNKSKYISKVCCRGKSRNLEIERSADLDLTVHILFPPGFSRKFSEGKEVKWLLEISEGGGLNRFQKFPPPPQGTSSYVNFEG